MGPSLTGIGYLKGRLGPPLLKRMYSDGRLGKYVSAVKFSDKSEVKGEYMVGIARPI
jgi:hypothetical protein